MNNNIKEYRTDRLVKLDLVNITLTDSISMADLNTKWHSLAWLKKQLKILGFTIHDTYTHGNFVTVYFK